MALRLAGMLQLKEQLDPDRMPWGWFPWIIHLDKARVGSPGKVVDIFDPVLVRDGAVRIVAGCDFFPAGPDDILSRRREFHVKSPKIRKELGVRMKLMAVPGVVPPHAHFGKPLPSQDKVVLVPGAGYDLWHFGFKANLECDFRAG